MKSFQTWDDSGFCHIKFYSCTRTRIFREKITFCNRFYVEVVAKYVFGCPVRKKSLVGFFFFEKRSTFARTDTKFRFKTGTRSPSLPSRPKLYAVYPTSPGKRIPPFAFARDGFSLSRGHTRPYCNLRVHTCI